MAQPNPQQKQDLNREQGEEFKGAKGQGSWTSENKQTRGENFKGEKGELEEEDVESVDQEPEMIDPSQRKQQNP